MTTSTPGPTRPPRALGLVGGIVDDRITALQRGLLSPTHRDANAVAALARLRRGAGKPTGSVLDVLEYTVSDRFWSGREDDPIGSAVTERRENASHLAMTLYAVHQQSRATAMHRSGHGLGAALRLHDAGQGPAVTQRFRMLGTAESFEELSHHLRGVVQLLRADSAPLDYGLLADQLVAWQDGGRSRVQLAWARGFYRTARAGSTDPDATDSPDPESPATDSPDA